jgi:hypothetical protein
MRVDNTCLLAKGSERKSRPPSGGPSLFANSAVKAGVKTGPFMKEFREESPETRLSPRDRRLSKRNAVQVRLELSDFRGSFSGRTVDVSRSGLFVATAETRPVGTLLRIRVLGPKGDSGLSVGVVVRTFDDVEESVDGGGGPSLGLALALTSTSESWDRFWDDVTASDDEGDS